MNVRALVAIGCASVVAVSLYGLLTATPSSRQSNPCPIDKEAIEHPQLPPGAHEVVIPVKKKAWEQAHGGEEGAKPYIRARLAGLPSRRLVDASTLPASDDEFAWRVARDTWRGIETLTDQESGLPIDNVYWPGERPGDADVQVRDYTSSSNIGLHLIAIVAAQKLQLLSSEAAIAKLRRVLDTLKGLETYQAFHFNFYDTTSLERTSNFVSFIDSSWLSAGLMVVRMSFPALFADCGELLAQTDYGFFFNSDTRQISHGYYLKPGSRSPFEYGMLYTEARLGSLIAIGKGDIPSDQWYAMRRTFPAACAWQTQEPKGPALTTVHGHEVWDGYFEWGGSRYVPSWGGSMFEALMPVLLLDEARYAPQGLGANDSAHATVQRRYATEQLGYPVWGLSPCATPEGDGYTEYGVKVLGARGYEPGAVTPHASALALSITPEAALANLRALAQRYPIYGAEGFYDAVDPRSGVVAYKYLSLDQSMLFISLANYLSDHAIQKAFAADPIMQRVLPMIADERFFE